MPGKTTTPDFSLTSDLLEDGTVLRLLYDRPKGNVITSAMLREMQSLLNQAENQSQLRLVVLRGAGGHFSYGTSIPEHRDSQAPDLLTSFHTFVRQLASFPVPVAVLLEGICFGGGLEIALCCHLVFATPNVLLACPEIKLGVFPPVLAAVGALRLGGPLAERLLLTGESINVTQAQTAGMITQVLPGVGDPEEALLAWYRQHLRPLSAFALRMAAHAGRAALIEALGAPLAHLEKLYLDKLLASHDGREGIAAFMEHRQPRWQNK